jgi:hypothetical protein
MDLTLTITEPLATQLRALAEQRGLSVEAAGQQVVFAGLIAVSPPIDLSNVVDLGPLHTTPPTDEQIRRSPKPLFVAGPVPSRELVFLDGADTAASNAD